MHQRQHSLTAARLIQLSSACLLFISFQLTLSAADWSDPFNYEPAFIENRGQFQLMANCNGDSEVLYAMHRGGTKVFFTRSGVSFSFNESISYKEHRKNEGYNKDRKEEMEQFETAEEWIEEETKERSAVVTFDHLSYFWPNSNPNVEINATGKIATYYSYGFKKGGKTVNENHIPAFQQLRYKNLYSGIDLIFYFDEDSRLKYELEIAPNADYTQFTMQYDRPVILDEQGNLRIETVFGDLIDHAPSSYLTESKVPVPSKFKIDNNLVSFQLSAYEQSKALTIDPWIQTPNFNRNWDCVWECESDAAGNAYIIGGTWPMQLLKYNAGGALQWVYNTPYDTSSWLGTFATDDAGNSYVTLGSTAAIQRINTAGGLVWDNPNPGGLFLSTEFWTITFNCDQTSLVIGGTGGTLPPLPFIYNVNMANGNVTNSVQVTGGALFPTQEVRAITSTKNAKYYYLTHDSIGFVHESLTSCVPPNSLPFHVSNGYNLGYKCENWRKNNTGISAIRHHDGFIYTHRGDRIDKRNFNSGAVIASSAIPGGSFNSVFGGGNTVGNSGLDIDECGNIFAGSRNLVVQFDENLNQILTFPTTFNVYDVAVAANGDVIAAGSTGNSGSGNRNGFVQSFATTACAQQIHVCCDASVCPQDPLCSTDAPVGLTSVEPGGVWSGPGIVNANNGTFDPSVAGLGTHTIVYTLPCGADSIDIQVNLCAMIDVCTENNGDLTASGGDGGPYTWYEPEWTLDCSACFPFPPCFPPGCETNTFSWNQVTTGNSVSPPPGSDTLRVTDGSGNEFISYDISAIVPCNVICLAEIDPAGPFCNNDQRVTLTAVEPGGTWSGSGIVNTSAGIFDPSILSPGSTNVYYFSPCGERDTLVVSILAEDNVSISYAQSNYCSTDQNPAPTIAGNMNGIFSISSGGQINTNTGEVDLANSSAGSHTITYISSGSCPDTATTTLTIDHATDATANPAGPYCVSEGVQQLSAINIGGVWLGNGIVDSLNGTFDPAIANIGSHLITHIIRGNCNDTGTITISIVAGDNATITYDANSYCLNEPNPTAQVTGTSGGSFSIDNNGAINVSDGTVDLTASGAGNFTITYITGGTCPDTAIAAISINSSFDATIDPAGPFCANEAQINLTAADAGGIWSGNGITDSLNGTFDPATAGAGQYTITYGIQANCGDTGTITIDVQALDDASFSYASASYCLNEPDPSPVITGNSGGTFSIDNGGGINSTSGVIDISASGIGNYTVTYITAGNCPDTADFSIGINSSFDASIDPAGPFCPNGGLQTLTAADLGGTWSGAGIVDSLNGAFDPAIAGSGNHQITYAIGGNCGDTAQLTISVIANDTAAFTYTNSSYCLSEADPVAIINGTSGGSFSIDNSGVINSSDGTIDLSASGSGNFIITYTTNGLCPDSSTFAIAIDSNFTAQIDLAGPFCASESATNLSATEAGGIWSGAGITDSLNGTFDPATAGIGNHDIAYTISGTCGDSDTIQIVVTAGDSALFLYDPAAFCLNEPNPVPTLTGTVGGIFSIDNGATIDGSTGNIDLMASGIGNFTVTYITNGSCPDTATQPIGINSSFDASINPQANLCANDNAVQLTAADAGGIWSGMGITDSINGLFNPAQAGVGNHFIDYQIAGSCGDSAQISISVNPSDTAAISYAPATYCLLDADPLPLNSGTTGGSFTIDGTGQIDPNSGQIDLDASGLGSFTIVYQTSGACAAFDTTTITIVDAPDASIDPVADLCENAGSQTLTAISTGGVWSGTGITDSLTGSFDPALVSGSTNVSYSFGGACPASDSIVIIVLQAPQLDLLTADTAICAGNAVRLNALSNDSLSWSTGESGSSILVEPTLTTTYSVSVSNSCGLDSSLATVTVNPLPDAEMIPDSTTITLGEGVILNASGGGQYNWFPTEGLNCIDCASPFASPEVNTIYCAEVNLAGCLDTVCALIEVRAPCDELFIPTVFSPNGDAINDEFILYGNCFEIIELRIFNRWGEMLFESFEPNARWDGKYKGKLQNPGVYVYVAHLAYLDRLEKLKGSITLVR